MKLYLSGPIKGLPDYNAAAFKAAATMLRAYGYDVVCPTEMSEEMVVRRGVASRDDISYGDYLIEDLAVLRSVDNIALLDGWAASVGAKLEIEFARAIGLGVLLVDPQVPGGLRKLTAADEARAYVMGARQKSYGHPRDNFARIANLWNAYIANQPDKAGIDAADVAQMMVLLKMARLQAGYHHDSLVDELGYGLTHQLIAEG